MQDGGVRANNPLAIAQKESVIVWPGAGRHDLLLSVGTGSSTTLGELPDTSYGNKIWNSAIPRLVRAAMSSPSMDGGQGFLEALNFVPDHMREDIHRLDHILPYNLPRLDDLDRMMELFEATYEVPDDLVRALLATGFFFFEADQTPTLQQGAFYCEGSILCKGPKSKCVVERVIREFPRAQFQIAGGQHLGLINDHEGCDSCGYYRKKVGFTVNSLEEIITIEIAGISWQKRIGGFPKSVQEILEDQQAYARFGRPDHLHTVWPPSRSCFCLRGTKGLFQPSEGTRSSKKRRLRY